MRDPDSVDYSEVIRGWAEDPMRGVGPFQSARMEEQRLDQMELRLGYPYLYQVHFETKLLMLLKRSTIS